MVINQFLSNANFVGRRCNRLIKKLFK